MKEAAILDFLCEKLTWAAGSSTPHYAFCWVTRNFLKPGGTLRESARKVVVEAAETGKDPCILLMREIQAAGGFRAVFDDCTAREKYRTIWRKITWKVTGLYSNHLEPKLQDWKWQIDEWVDRIRRM